MKYAKVSVIVTERIDPYTVTYGGDGGACVVIDNGESYDAGECVAIYGQENIRKLRDILSEIIAAERWEHVTP